MKDEETDLAILLANLKGTKKKDWFATAKACRRLVRLHHNSYKKVAEGKWVEMTKKQYQAHVAPREKTYDKVKEAMTSVSSYDYARDLTQGGDKFFRDQYAALERKIPNLPITYKRFMQIINRRDIQTGMDEWEAIRDEIIKKKKVKKVKR